MSEKRKAAEELQSEQLEQVAGGRLMYLSDIGNGCGRDALVKQRLSPVETVLNDDAKNAVNEGGN